MLTVFAVACWTSTCPWLVKGRTEVDGIAHRSSCWRRVRTVVVEDEHLGCKQARKSIRRMRTVSVVVGVLTSTRGAHGFGVSSSPELRGHRWRTGEDVADVLARTRASCCYGKVRKEVGIM